MANWQSTLNIANDWQKCQRNEITLIELSKVIASKLEKIRDLDNQEINEEKECLITEFKLFEGDSRDDFDELMEQLYNWGDILLDNNSWPRKRVCWIKTF